MKRWALLFLFILLVAASLPFLYQYSLSQNQTKDDFYFGVSYGQETLKKAGLSNIAIKQTTPAILLNNNTAILSYAWEMQKDGKAESTIKGRVSKLKQLAKQCDLNQPEEFKAYLTTMKALNSAKNNYADTYRQFLKFKGIDWKKPKYQIETKLPFIPTETEIDQLIASCGKKLATFLQTLKETGIRGAEAKKLKWIHLDTERKTVNITPSKGSNPRILPISDKLLNMLNNIRKNNESEESIFAKNTHIIRTSYCRQRKNIAEKLSNPRLRKISFHTLRHWKATMEYHKTKDIIHVMQILGHKSIKNTMKYINIENSIHTSKNDEWTSRISHSLEEEQQLIDTGFELVRSINETTAMYKKRK
jgi:integrase